MSTPHYQCTLCDTNNPLSATHCSNPDCGALLAMYAKVIVPEETEAPSLSLPPVNARTQSAQKKIEPQRLSRTEPSQAEPKKPKKAKKDDAPNGRQQIGKERPPASRTEAKPSAATVKDAEKKETARKKKSLSTGGRIALAIAAISLLLLFLLSLLVGCGVGIVAILEDLITHDGHYDPPAYTEGDHSQSYEYDGSDPTDDPAWGGDPSENVESDWQGGSGEGVHSEEEPIETTEEPYVSPDV